MTGMIGGSPPVRRTRVLGLAILVLVIVAGAVAGRLTGPGIAGTPAPLPLVRPAVGDCAVVFSAQVYVVPCATSHTAEVAAVYPPGQSTDTEQLFQPCQQAAGSYVPAPTKAIVAGWRLSRPEPNSEVLTGPDWRVCLVDFTFGTNAYVGSVRDPAGAGIYGSCRLATQNVSCGQPHSSQDFGEVDVTEGVTTADGTTTISDPARRTAYLDQCARLASVLMNAADPTAGGKLGLRLVNTGTIGTVTMRNAESAPATSPITPGPVQVYQSETVGGTFTCRADYSGRGYLIGTLLGLGNRPLPVQR